MEGATYAPERQTAGIAFQPSYVDLESRGRSDHPLRAIDGIVDDALVTLTRDFV